MYERLKSGMVNAATDAGDHLLSARNSKKTAYEIEKKSRDLALKALRNIDPNISVWGEGSMDGNAVAICPLDAYINYSRGFGPYGSMAAYIRDGTAMFGAVYLPESDGLISAEAGKGARLKGRKVNASNRGNLKESIICCNCESYDVDLNPLALRIIEALSKGMIPWRNIGSPAAAYFALAVGEIDGVIEPFQDSTHAAGHLIMRESGARITDQDGNPYNLFSKAVIAAGPRVHEGLMELLRDAL